MEGQGRAGDAVQGWQAEGLPGKIGESVFDLQSQLQGKAELFGLLDLPAECLARGTFEELAGERVPNLQEEGVEGGGRGSRSRSGSVPMELGVLGQVPVTGTIQVPETELRPVAQALRQVLGYRGPILIYIGHSRGADPQPALEETLGSEGGARLGKDLPIPPGWRTGPLAFQGGDELADLPLVLGAVGRAQVHPGAGGEEGGQLGVDEEDG